MSLELHSAVDEGDIARVEDLLSSGVDVDQMSSFNEAPLHRAALHGRADIAEMLLDRGAKIATRNADGYEPVHLAVIFGSLPVLRLLLARGADVNARGFADWTPLHVAFGHRWASEAVGILVSAGANLNALDRLGETPLDKANFYNVPELLKSLREHGARTSAELRRSAKLG